MARCLGLVATARVLMSGGSVLIPVRVGKPWATRKATRHGPLIQACRTNPARVEGIPKVSALALPYVVLSGSPAAERAADAGTGTVGFSFASDTLLNVRIGNDWGQRKPGSSYDVNHSGDEIRAMIAASDISIKIRVLVQFGLWLFRLLLPEFSFALWSFGPVLNSDPHHGLELAQKLRQYATIESIPY